MNGLNWETLGVIAALIGLGVPVLLRVGKATAHLAELKERFGECKQEDRKEHEDFRKCLQAQGVQLAEHEQRITTLEN